jgi:hypothetical protein
MKMEVRKKLLSKNRLSADLVRNSYDPEKRTIEVVFATGAPVQRYSWSEGYYTEKLSMKKSDVRLERLNAGAPVLNNHSNYDLRDIIGVVESAKITKGEGIATLKLSEREEVAGIVQDIRDGVIRNVSVGYKIHAMKEEKKRKDDEIPTFTAIDWEPLEVSFVTIPADASAQARGEDKQNYEDFVVINKEENIMGKKNDVETNVRTDDSSATDAEVKTGEQVSEEVSAEDLAAQGPVSEAATVTETETEERSEPVNAEEIVKLERSRVTEIRSLAKTHELADDFVEKLINEGQTLEEVRSLTLKHIEERNAKTKTFGQNLEVNDVDNKQLRNEARVRTMLHRFDSDKYQLKDGDREFAGGSIIDLCREYLQTEMNEKDVLRMSKTQVAKRALHHSSDFPELLANTANKSLRDAYESTPNTFEPFTRSIVRPDFKEGSSIQISDGGKLEKVNEHGEYERGSVQESAEKYKMEKFGKILGRTWELMVNDDLDAFTRLPSRLGVRAREKENEIMWGLILSNAGLGQVMAEDGNNLFDADHGNYTSTGTAISIDSLGVARSLMRLQRDLDGELISGLAPQYLYVPTSLETKAEQFVSQITPDQSGNVNPFANRLQVVVEPRLDAVSQTHWYAMANKSMIDMAEIARLDGRGPEIFTREGFDVDGMEVKVRYVFGGRIIDYRGFYRNVGA